MSIADKLQTIANNLATESEAVEQQTELLQQIRTALVGKTVPGDPGASGGYDEGYEDGYAKGEQEGYNKGYADGTAKYMWAPYIRSGSQLFREAVFPENTEISIEYLDIVGHMQHFMRYAKNVKKLTLICPTYSDTLVDCTYLCYHADDLETVDISRFNRKISFVFAFSTCHKLREIVGVMDMSNTTALTNTLDLCSALEEFRIAPGSAKVNFSIKDSPNLTDETIQSVIDGLADLTGATAQTVSFHKDVGNKLTQTQKDAISAKNWTLVY